MKPILIWDLPVRLFHALFGAGFIAAATIALLGEHGPLFPYHALIGLSLVFLVILRILWGFTGSRYARFGSFVFGPGAVLRYFTGLLSRKGDRFLGHNPGSAVAIFSLFGLMLALGATGYMLGTGNESVKEVHELLAYAMMGVAGIHVLGVIVHTLLNKENIASSMVVGRKSGNPEDAISSPYAPAALVMLALVAAWSIGLYRNFDGQSTRLPLLGTQLTLGENENEGGARDGKGERKAREDHDRDND